MHDACNDADSRHMSVNYSAFYQTSDTHHMFAYRGTFWLETVIHSEVFILIGFEFSIDIALLLVKVHVKHFLLIHFNNNHS